VEITRREETIPHNPIIPERRGRDPRWYCAATADREKSSAGDPMFFCVRPMPAFASALASATPRVPEDEHDRTISSGWKDADEKQHAPAAKFAKYPCAPGGICRLMSEPMMFPSAESAWAIPAPWPGTAPARSRPRASSRRQNMPRCQAPPGNRYSVEIDPGLGKPRQSGKPRIHQQLADHRLHAADPGRVNSVAVLDVAVLPCRGIARDGRARRAPPAARRGAPMPLTMSREARAMVRERIAVRLYGSGAGLRRPTRSARRGFAASSA